MNGLTSPDLSERPPPRSQRSSSISNDRTSLSVASLACPPSVEPIPAYIAASSASQIVTGDQELETVNTLVAPNALLLLNAFLDQLLYSFLALSRSTSITALRPAVTDVLKPGLARDAIASADGELQSIDGDNDVLSAFHQELESRAAWDLGKIWRRTRLRIMVYTHLGDLEEQDEKDWLQRENAGREVDGQHRLSNDLGVVSPVAAIFLTSILEYIAEQVLLISAEAAYTRFESRGRQGKPGPADLAEDQRLSVEVVDIEKLAVNTTFGRLWRSWKKKVRSPSIAQQRRSSLEHFLRPNSSLSASDPRSREPSVGEETSQNGEHETQSKVATDDNPEEVQEVAAIPLPTTTCEAKEIAGSEFPSHGSRRDMIERPRSVLLSSQMADQHDDNRARGPGREILQRNRSSSLPTVAHWQYLGPPQTSYLNPKANLMDEPRTYPTGLSQDGSNATAVMTMYDGTIAREEGAMDEEQRYRTNDSHPHDEQQDEEARNLDKGLDSLVRGSIDSNDSPMQIATQKPEIRSLMVRREDSTDQSAVKYNQDKMPDSSRTQPRGVENQLDSSRMQGHTTENVSLDNRETSIVETQPPQTLNDRNVLSDLPANDEGDDYVSATLGISTPYGNRFDGPPYGQLRQRNGTTPRNLSEMPGSRAIAAASPSPTFPHAKPSVKLSEIRKQLPPVRTGVERASVQRLSSSSGGGLESPLGRTSTSSSRDLRPIYTSGSSASQTASKSKVLGARGSSDTSRQYAVSRRSSEASNTLATPLVKTPEVDETQNSFEKLIKSDETIQYTLTPQSVRDSDSLDSPRYSHSRTETADLADFIRSSGPPSLEEGRPATNRSIVSLKGLNGLRSSPTATSKAPVVQGTTPSRDMPSSPSQYSRPTTARSANGPPRDAQPKPENIDDFADFIRSTGPDVVAISDSGKDKNAAMPSTKKPRPTKAMLPNNRTSSAASTGKKITKANPSLSKSPPPVASPAPVASPQPATSPPPHTRPVPKLQAREPTYGPEDSEELLKLLKEGPANDEERERDKLAVPTAPVASIVPQNPRVPTNLRNRYSDNTRSSISSTQDSAYANKSIRSTNSRTGLLDSSRGSYGGSPPLSQRAFRFDDPPQAARKQRRVKDPYAIDTDSEGEGSDTSPKPNNQEESLIDFLNSTPPLSDPKSIIPSAFDDMPNITARSTKINKKASDMYKQRNARAAASASGSATPGIRTVTQAPISSPQRGRASKSAAPSTQPPQLPPLNSRDISPHLMSAYTPSSTANGTASASSAPRKVKPVGTARLDNDDNMRGMSDLADFLRNSEPPTQVPKEMMAGQPSTEEKEAEAKGLWGRFKKRRGR